ncbi:MAG: universal stress protein [Chloroflexota bacterium]
MQYVAQHPIDVIAMTTHGRSGLKQLFLGSVANRLVNVSHVPVVLVRPESA